MVVDDDENGIGITEADMMKTYALEYNMDSLGSSCKCNT